MLFLNVPVKTFSFCYFSEERGLHLIIESVGADSPAFRSGAREGDIIVAVDDWLITPMDRPQVRAIARYFNRKWRKTPLN